MEQEEKQEQRIRISVRSLVEFILRSGDIDDRRGAFAQKEAMQEGSRIHRKIQGRMGSGYRAEVPLSIDVPADGFVLTVEGRADGIFQMDEVMRAERGVLWSCTEGEWTAKKRSGADEEGKVSGADDTGNGSGAENEETLLSPDSAGQERCRADMFIDEIKGVYRDVALIREPVAVHLAQAKCYAYIYGSQEGLERVGVQMTYCNMETEEIRRFREEYSVRELEGWFFAVVREYQKWAKLELDWKETRQASIRELTFPFPWREGQEKTAAAVYRTMRRKKKLFIQAPTGTGKTLSTVFPAVKAMGEGLADHIFYATAKTVTRTVAEEAYAILRGNGLRMKTVTLTAKEKICFLGESACNPEACPYAKGHFDRVNDAVFEFLSSGEVFDRPAIEAQAEKWQVCPFEFGLDVTLWADAVICDYNYIFDPRARLKRFFGEGVKGDYLFLIDEAHNLVERGREMFSASLVKEDFLELRKLVRPHSQKMARALGRCNTWLLERKREPDAGAVQVLPDVGTFPVHLMNLCGIMEDFLEDSRDAEVNDKVLELYFQARRFLDVCDLLGDDYVIYTELSEDGRFRIRLFCVDVSKNLQECLDRGKSTIFFSATLLPIQYYKSLLSTEKENYAIYAHSIFPRENRRVMIGTDTTSRYTSRTEREYRKMAEYVFRLILAKRGNYMIFFPSYRMMDEVAQQFGSLCEEQGEEIRLLCQESGMKEAQREEFLRQFEQQHEQGLAGFCVMGGIFGEGIDLRGERLVGAVIVGTGIPQVCTEREMLKQFYDKRGEDGFFYAYLCPGMNKVLQSAGRVIRTEEDEGIILLLDERFAAARYRRMFPEEWGNPGLCTLADVRAKAEEFWAERNQSRTEKSRAGQND